MSWQMAQPSPNPALGHFLAFARRGEAGVLRADR
jgi:hypothetical protein